jgi:hypothetical protein
LIPTVGETLVEMRQTRKSAEATRDCLGLRGKRSDGLRLLQGRTGTLHRWQKNRELAGTSLCPYIARGLRR